VVRNFQDDISPRNQMQMGGGDMISSSSEGSEEEEAEEEQYEIPHIQPMEPGPQSEELAFRTIVPEGDPP
jgi:hypothetical protein